MCPGFHVHGGCISGAAAWPCCVSLLCKLSSFAGSLHWPAGAEEKGHFGVSFLEVFIRRLVTTLHSVLRPSDSRVVMFA